MKVEIVTTDKGLIFDILGKNSASVGDGIEIPGNAKVTYQGTEFKKALGVPDIIILTITIGSGVASGLIANWLFEKLKGKCDKLTIERTEVQIDQGEIKKIIEEKITKG